MTSSVSVSIPLTELLLRPSTLQRFTKRGFESTDEIEESRASGGINLLASELDVSLQEAAGLIREVQGCLGQYEQSRARRNSSGGRNSNTSGTLDHHGNETNDDAGSVHCDNDENDTDTYRQHHQQEQQQCDDGIVTAYELLQRNDCRLFRTPGKKQPHRRRHIVTFCRSIDDLLGGGIALGEVTEVAGMPGTGKTQLATQLSVLARLPQIYGGVEGRALYVDAEGSFVAERAHSMATALFHHAQGRAHQKAKRDRNRGHGSDGSGTVSTPVGFSTEGILDSIDVFRVHDETALLATLYSLRQYIEASSSSSPTSTVLEPSSSSSSLPVKLIIIDSLAFHFRAVTPTDPSYYVQRTKTLTALAAYLGDLAHQNDLAVVVINQMTTKMNKNNSNSNSSTVVPALGESWAHATATRLLLSKEERFLAEQGATNDDDDPDEADPSRRVRHECRSCSLIKSGHRPMGTARYRILEEGIRDVPGEQHERRTNKRSRSD